MFKAVFFLSMLAIAVCAALFSIVGIGYIFQKALLFGVNAAIIYAATLEVGKLVVASFLYRERRLWFSPINLGLSIVLVGMMVVTSAGVYGFLAKGYEETYATQRHNAAFTEALTDEKKRLSTELESLQSQIANLPANYARSRGALYDKYKANIERNQTRISELDAKLLKLKTDSIEIEAHIGSIANIARALNMPQEKVVFWMIVLLVVLADPTAVLMTFGLNRMLEKRNERAAKPPAVTKPAESDEPDGPHAYGYKLVAVDAQGNEIDGGHTDNAQTASVRGAGGIPRTTVVGEGGCSVPEAEPRQDSEQDRTGHGAHDVDQDGGQRPEEVPEPQSATVNKRSRLRSRGGFVSPSKSESNADPGNAGT